MKLQEIFDQLGTAEFSQIAIGGQPAGVINDINQGKVVNHLNLGLTALFSRFSLKTGEVSLKLLPNVYLYRVHSDHSLLQAAPATAPKYLLDTAAARFKNDILKIEQVLLDSGLELSLNDTGDCNAALTPSANVLQVPAVVVDKTFDVDHQWLKTDNLKLRYRASHPRIVVGDDPVDPTVVEVDLPYTHLTALLWFIASRAHNPVGMGQEFNSGNTYYAKYEAECQRLEGAGLQINQAASYDRLRSGGWV